MNSFGKLPCIVYELFNSFQGRAVKAIMESARAAGSCYGYLLKRRTRESIWHFN